MLGLIKCVSCASAEVGFTLQQTTRPIRQDSRSLCSAFQVSFLVEYGPVCETKQTYKASFRNILAPKKSFVQKEHLSELLESNFGLKNGTCHVRISLGVGRSSK